MVVEEAGGGVVSLDNRTNKDRVIDTGKVTSLDVSREVVMVEEAEQSGGGSGRRSSRARWTGTCTPLRPGTDNSKFVINENHTTNICGY
jgi:hypothetical protein